MLANLRVSKIMHMQNIYHSENNIYVAKTMIVISAYTYMYTHIQYNKPPLVPYNQLFMRPRK